MSDARADGPLEPLGWLTWPTVYVRSPESVVMIDIAPIDEDEVTWHALPDIEHDVRILGTSAPSATATRADRPARGARSRAASAPFRHVEAGRLHLADDLTAFIREEV
jgi:hypothetical protein